MTGREAGWTRYGDILALLAGLVLLWWLLAQWAGEEALTGPAETLARARQLLESRRFHGHITESLTALAGRYATHLRDNLGVPLADISWTSQVGRSRQRNGLAVTGSTAGELADALEAFGRGERGSGVVTAELPVHKHRKTAWLFTGQGSQYAGMARGLADVPAFRVPFDEAADLFDVHLDRPLASVVWPEPGQESPVDDTRYTQPALFALEYGLTELWRSWGVSPAAVIGHSVGEYVAACAAGVFDLETGLRLIAERGALMHRLPPGGAMAAAIISPVPRDEKAGAAARPVR